MLLELKRQSGSTDTSKDPGLLKSCHTRGDIKLTTMSKQAFGIQLDSGDILEDLRRFE
jgi:hypothetical protein